MFLSVININLFFFIFLKKKTKYFKKLFIYKKLNTLICLLKNLKYLYLIFFILFEILVSKKKTQKLVIFFFKKNVFVVTFVKKFKFIYSFEVSWIRTNDGTTNRFTVCRFNHSAITSNNIKTNNK